MSGFRNLGGLLVGALYATSLHAQASPPDSAAGAPVAATFQPTAFSTASLDVADTVVKRRPKAVDLSDAYETRLKIHHYASYLMIPLFVEQLVTGNQLYQADKSGAERPGWAKGTHSLGAFAIGSVFTINTVTGLWNLWESRDNENGRGKRWIHSALMLASDAGFTYTGIVLASDAKRDAAKRDDHRNYAYYSMGAALTGYGIMLIGDH